MSVLKINFNQLNKPYRFNMVNNNLSCKPLYLTVYPKYINLQGNIFYAGLTHYECNLHHDIEKILGVMDSKLYGRYEETYGATDTYPIRFAIYHNQIFFSDLMSLSVYKNDSNIRKEINQKYHLQDEFYEPTWEEIYQDYFREFFLKNRKKYGNHVEWHRLNLTPQEYFRIMISAKNRELSPFIDANALNAYDLRYWLNCNIDSFIDFTYPWETTGVYNQETMAFLNSLKETKLDIYHFFDQFSKQAKDWPKAVQELLVALGKHSSFTPSKKESKDIFSDDSKYEENIYWDNLFSLASYDMLVQWIGFDKIETQLSKTITTSKPNIYETFFNFFLMDYDIIQLPRLIFEEDTQQFRWINPNEFMNLGINRECEQEIKLIKKYVPPSERKKYFKK